MNHIYTKKNVNDNSRELLISEKQSICHYKNEHPTATRLDIVHYFQDKWGKQITVSSVKEVLQKKERWMAVPSNKFDEKRKRYKTTKIREIETALYVGLCDEAVSTDEPITNDVICSKGKEFFDEIIQNGIKFCGSKNWMCGFKRRFGICKDGSTQKYKYGHQFESVYKNKTSLIGGVREAGLENTYLLITVPLCHLYKPNILIEPDLSETLLVFLCVNAAGTDMLPPLVLGPHELDEKIDKLKYHQETEAAWGFVHWLLLAEQHLQKQALVITGPEKFIACLPSNSLKVQLRKLSVKVSPVLKEVLEKIPFLFKASFRQMQMKDTKVFEGNYLSKCLQWIRDAWWGLPGGALHGYWHCIPEVIERNHECKLKHNAFKLCAAIEAIALQHLMTALDNTKYNPLDAINIESHLPVHGRLTVNEIVNVLMLYDQLFKTIRRDSVTVPENGELTSNGDSELASSSVQNGHDMLSKSPVKKLRKSQLERSPKPRAAKAKKKQQEILSNDGNEEPPECAGNNTKKCKLENPTVHAQVRKTHKKGILKPPLIKTTTQQQQELTLNPVVKLIRVEGQDISYDSTSSHNGVLQNCTTVPVLQSLQTESESAKEKELAVEMTKEPLTEKSIELVSKEEAIGAIETVIRYLSYKTEEKQLYRDALKIWNFMDLQ